MAQDKELRVKISADAKQAQAELKKTAKASQDAADAVVKSAQRQTKAIDDVGQSAKQAAFAMRQVPAQFTDIVVSLQGGQNPMQVLLQQGGQLKDLFGGTGNAVRALSGYIAGLITPTTAVVGAAIGLAAAFAAGEAQSSRLRQSILASGNAAGTSVGQLDGLVQKIGEVTRDYGTARDAAEALVGSGQVSAQNLEAAMRGVAAGVKLTGRDVKDLTEDFVDIGKDPVKAVTELNSKYNFLTVSVFEQIKALQEQGKTQEAATLATKTYADTLAGRTGEMVQNLGYVESAWEGIKKAASGAKDAILSVGRESSQAERIAEIQAKLSQGKTARGQDILGTKLVRGRFVSERTTLENELKTLQAQAAADAEKSKKQADAAAKNNAIIAADAPYKSFINSILVGKEALNAEIKKLEQDRDKYIGIFGKGSEKAIEVAKATQAKVAELRANFDKKNQPKAAKGAVNPLTVSFATGADELANTKQNLSAIVEAVQDKLAFAAQLYDTAYKNNTISLQEYYDKRVAITEESANQELAQNRKLIDAITEERANVANAAVKTDKDKEAQRNRIADLDKQLLDLNNKNLIVDRERGQAVDNIALQRANEVETLQDKLAKIDLQNAIDSGVDSQEMVAEAIREKYKDDRAQSKNVPGGEAIIKRQIELEINKDSLSRAEDEFNRVLERMRVEEQSINVKRSAGILSERQAREDLLELQTKTAEAVRNTLPELEKAAGAIGEKQVERVRRYRLEFEQLANVKLVEFERRLNQVRDSLVNAGQGFFQEILSGGSAKDAIGAFMRDLNNQLTTIISREASEAIFGSGGIFDIGKLFGNTSAPKGTKTDPIYVAQADVTGQVVEQASSGIGDIFSVLGGFGGLGGILPGFAEGGKIVGPGTGTSDDVLMWGSNGEFVMPEAETRKYLPILEAMRSGALKVKGYAEGGVVTNSDGLSLNLPTSGEGELTAARLNDIRVTARDAMNSALTSAQASRQTAQLFEKGSSLLGLVAGPIAGLGAKLFGKYEGYKATGFEREADAQSSIVQSVDRFTAMSRNKVENLSQADAEFIDLNKRTNELTQSSSGAAQSIDELATAAKESASSVSDGAAKNTSTDGSVGQDANGNAIDINDPQYTSRRRSSKPKPEVNSDPLTTNEAPTYVFEDGSIFSPAAKQDALSDVKGMFSGLYDTVNQYTFGFLDLISNVFGSLGSWVSNLVSGAGNIGSQLLGGGGAGSLLGGFSSLFGGIFHNGGLVGAGNVKLKLPGYVFNAAPRYHSGGIAGLAPNEVPAVLQRGEEVLTQNDPRHRDNMAAPSPSQFTIINAIDKNELQDAAWGSGADKKLINKISANRSAIRGALGI